MSDSDRPLPRPPSTPFTRGRRGAADADQPLTVDRMAEASAEGRLEEFLDAELGGNEHKKALAAMMLGMSGLAMPAGGAAFPPADAPPPDGPAPVGVVPPEDLAQAAQAGDVAALMGHLRREHAQRNPGSAAGAAAAVAAPDPGAASPAPAPATAAAEREVLEQLVKIAAENDVGVDWLVLRALKLFVADFQRTGRL